MCNQKKLQKQIQCSAKQFDAWMKSECDPDSEEGLKAVLSKIKFVVKIKLGSLLSIVQLVEVILC